MEISLDNMQVSFMTAGIKTASDSVSLTAAETEIKSRSEAMDKFQEEYRQLKAFVKAGSSARSPTPTSSAGIPPTTSIPKRTSSPRRITLKPCGCR